MYNPINAVLRNATRKEDDPLNILTYIAHERFEPNLCLTGHNFYSITTDGTRTWNEKYSAIPPNYHIFVDTVPDYFLNNIDAIISHNPFVHIPLALKLNINVPIINIFHTMPGPGWNPNQIQPECLDLFNRCFEHVYISEFNKVSWNYNRGKIIHHGIDTDLFCNHNLKKELKILTVANDYINRDWALGFSIWKYISNHFNMFPIGETPGLSKPTNNVAELIHHYNTSQIFLNTSTASPIPMSLIEAMSCECACVSSATCMIPDIIEHGKDGYLCPPNKPEKFKEYIELLFENPDHAKEMGKNAREKIKSMFSLKKFVQSWNILLKETINAYSNY